MRRLLAFLLSLSVMFTCVGGLSLSVFADGTLQGSGTSDDPYLISSAEEFALIANNLSADYKQTADFSVTAPITGIFTGTYDGDGHTITATLTTTTTASGQSFGLFTQIGGSETDFAEIKNLTLRGSVTSTADSAERVYMGGFAGLSKTGYVKLSNLINYADVKNHTTNTNDNIGGIAGRFYISNTYIENCVNYGEILGKTYAGGIVGMQGDANGISYATNCQNYGKVTAKTAAGIAGWTYVVNYSKCFNVGNIISDGQAIGLIGMGSRSLTVDSCFNAGTLTKKSTNVKVGGLVRLVADTYTATVTNSYNTYPGVKALYLEKGAFSATNIYNVSADDEGITVVTPEELSETKISDNFVLYTELSDDDSKAYIYPQIIGNTIPSGTIFGSGTDADPYIVGDEIAFDYFFGQSVPNDTFYNTTKTIHIVSDIDLSKLDTPYAPYNKVYKAFQGKVYGKDHFGNDAQVTVDFGTMGSATAPVAPMVNGNNRYLGGFAGIANEVEFKNLTVEGTLYSSANGGTGGILGYANGKAIIDNCISKMNIICTTSNTGGILGTNANKDTVITNCVSTGSVKADIQGIGGIIGYATRPPKSIANNKNSATVVGGKYAGGILGYFVGWKNTTFTLNIDNCINEGNVSSDDNAFTGGILGGSVPVATSVSNVKITNSKNSGVIYAKNQAGGILGGFNDLNATNSTAAIANCENTGSVSTEVSFAAGIIGDSVANALSVTSSVNEASITAGSNCAAGIVGRSHNGSATITDCINEGNIKGVAYIAGVIGQSFVGLTVTDSHNKGLIEGSGQYAAGIGSSTINAVYRNCSNTGKIYSTCTQDVSYAAGIAGLIKTDKTEGEYGVYNSFNAGEIDAQGARNGGIIGYAWKEAAAAGDIADFVVENCYSVGKFTNSTGNASFVGATYNKHTYNDNTMTIKGSYSTVPYKAIYYRNVTKGETAMTWVITDTYNASELAAAEDGYELISEEELVNLTKKSGSVFNNPEIWQDSTNGYLYPQLVGNIYNVKTTPVPYNVEVANIDSAYILTWATRVEATGGYKVMIDGVQYGDITTAKSVDITEAVAGKNVTIKVIAIDSEEYESEEVMFSGIFNGGIGSEESPYIVATKEQLMVVSLYPDAHFVQDGDIEGITAELGFTKENPFTGSYDGAGYSIDLDIETAKSTINGGENIGGGLFAYVSGNVVIKDVVTTGTFIANKANAGAIVGLCLTDGFSLSGLKNYASVSGDSRETAGVIGRAYHKGTIENCYNYGDVTGASTTSGVVGVISGSTKVTDCGNYGNITGGSNAAGICAWAYGGATNCFNVGKISAGVACGILAQVQSHFDGNTNAPNHMLTIKDCYNLGTLEGTTSCGIACRATGRNGGYTVTGCYNATYATNPICDLTDEFVNSFNQEYSKNVGVTDCFFLASDEEYVSPLAGATKVSSLADLENIAFTASTAYAKSGDLKYPQLKDNKLDTDKDDIDFVKVSLDRSSVVKAGVMMYRLPEPAYIKKGDSVVVTVIPNEFYSIELFKGDASLGLFTERTDIMVEINEDAVIVATEDAIDVSEPDTMITGTEIFVANNEVITVDESDFTRYAIVAAKVEKASGLKVKEFGMLLNLENGDFTIETAKAKAKADDEKINDNGAYGILIHGEDIKSNYTYYARPYVIYEDKDGAEYPVYGTVSSFVITDAE